MEINKDQPKLTALQYWNQTLRLNLEKALSIKRTRSLVVPLRIYEQRAQQAMAVAEQFENTRHRITIDALIHKADSVQNFFGKLPWYRFTKRAKVKAEINGIKASILIVLNTIPPTEESLNAKPAAK